MIFNKQLIDLIGKKLKDRKESVATAESVTSGLLQAAISNAEGAAQIFQGGITAYNIGQKCRHLLVEPLHAMECNCVSERIAIIMSRSASNLFLSDFGIGITGYAAPVPEKNVHELFCYYSISLKEKVLKSGKITAKTEEGFATQIFYVNEVLKVFSDLI